MDEARLFDTFERLLAISAPSGQEEPVRHLLEERLSALGFACRRDARGNLLGARPGAGAPVLLCAHMDTVPLAAGARVVSDAQGYRSDGSTALGADDRAGIAVILEALASQSARSAEVLFTVEEERALAGSRAADLGGFAARQALIPDSSLDVGALVLQTPTKARLSIEVLGRAAHAALGAGAGVSAICAAAAAVAALPEPPAGVTFNIGSFLAGGPTNVVCARAALEAEARAFDEAALDAFIARVRAAFERGAAQRGAVCRFRARTEYRGYRVAEDDPAVLRFRAACGRAGVPFAAARSMGGSDGNSLAGAGIVPLVMGTGAKCPHAVEERISRASLQSAALVAEYYLKEEV